MQLMQNAEINGVMYQQGTLAGYELREYLLEVRFVDQKPNQKWNGGLIPSQKGIYGLRT